MAPASGLPRSVTSLPLSLSTFVGRARELDALRDLLPLTRLLTLTGPGGVGKTRLAFELVSSVAPGGDYADGVVTVELSGLGDANLIEPSVASRLGLSDDSFDSVIEWLRTRELLLVLDNCEHLIDGCARLVERLLHGAPALRILATSREPLGLVGETIWRVPSLSVPEEDTPRALAQADAARLFLARAQQARGLPFDVDELDQLDRPTLTAIASICRRLDGLPLAIELAAARMRLLSAPDIAARLDDRLRLLTSGSRTAPARQQTLRATLQWSYDLLSSAEQLLLQRLSVFRGSWTLAAAESICGDDGLAMDQVLDVLGLLVDRSLVLVSPFTSESTRYRLQDSVRLFGCDYLSQHGELDYRTDRHARFFLDLSERESAELVGPTEDAAVRRLHEEDDNLRAALRRFVTTEDAANALRMAACLGLYWFFRSALSEGRAWLDEVLGMPSAIDISPARARCLFAAANLAMAQGDYVPAMERAQASLADWRTLDDARQAAAPLSLTGQLTRMLGDYPRAEAILQQAVHLAHHTANLTYEVLALVALADLALRQGALLEARRFGERGLERARDSGRPRLIVHALRAVADVQFEQGVPDAARALADQSVAMTRERVGSAWWLVLGLMCSAKAAIGQHDFGSAASSLVEAVRLSREIGNPAGVVAALEVCAYLASAQRFARRAVRLSAAATVLRAGLGHEPIVPLGERMRRLIEQQTTALLAPAVRAEVWQEGTGLRLDEAVAYALSAPVPEDVAEAVRAVDALTPREREVARLVAQGLTNRQVAEQLVLTEKTAANHIGRVFDKLGVHSRGQLAARAAELGLAPG